MKMSLAAHPVVRDLRGAPVGSVTYKLLSSYRIARFGLHLGPWRDAALRAVRAMKTLPTIDTNDADVLPGLDIEAVSRKMKSDGYVRGPRLPERYVRAILDHCASLPPTTTYIHPHRGCPELAELATNAKVVEIVRRYLGAEPVLYHTVVLVTRPCPVDGERKWRFHYDVGDFRAMTLWVYLTDVDAASGPHAVIQGTHRRDTVREVVDEMLSVEEAALRYGDRCHTLLGESGSSIFEDQVIYHRQAPCDKPRTILGISYVTTREPLRYDP
jgi:hypothetical protein